MLSSLRTSLAAAPPAPVAIQECDPASEFEARQSRALERKSIAAPAVPEEPEQQMAMPSSSEEISSPVAAVVMTSPASQKPTPVESTCTGAVPGFMTANRYARLSLSRSHHLRKHVAWLLRTRVLRRKSWSHSIFHRRSARWLTINRKD